jgi:hypothetical protein
MNNPFNLTRAADLDDQQIVALWVDPKEELGKRLRLSSELPMIILGGKGSGKTHLMRYYSYDIQQRSDQGQSFDPVRESGYLGVYTRCSGLSADRFARKSFSEEQWHVLFAFFVELWLGQSILRTAVQYLNRRNLADSYDEKLLVKDLLGIFDKAPTKPIATLGEYAEALRTLQRQLDMAVANASFRTVEMPEIIIGSGHLLFGLPKILARHIPAFAGIKFTLLVDEYENLPERAQRYINTLVRERENPVTFKIGARLYGMRTYLTFSGDEELREGSEYELLNLDAALRQKEKAYERFAMDLCLSRIKFANHGVWPLDWNDENAEAQFVACFEPAVSMEERAKRKLAERPGELAPWLRNLQQHLTEHIAALETAELLQPKEVPGVLEVLRHEDPLIEKTSTFLLYRAWSSREPLAKAARKIAESSRKFGETGDRGTDHWRVLDKFRDDLRAQMLKDLGLDQSYTGLATWIRMSSGIARNLIITLKHIFDWATFYQEGFGAPQGISLRSQAKGVEDASDWFVSDAQILGQDLVTVQAGIKRTCALMRTLRFAEKPPECSLSTFEVDLDGALPEVRRIIELSQKWSIYIPASDRPERNSGGDVSKYRINGMIAPKYDLPIYTRGSVHLTQDEAQVIFGAGSEADYARVVRARELRVRPPFSRGSRSEPESDHEPELF